MVGCTLYAPGHTLFFETMAMLSFVEYASEKRILELLVKERVKIALKGKLNNSSPTEIVRRVEDGSTLTIAEQMFMLMPPRDSWHKPTRRERLTKDGVEKKSNKQILTRSIALTIRLHRKSRANHPYLARLDEFIASLRGDVIAASPLQFTSMRVYGQKKKVAVDGTIIYRPICVFESLREKLLVSLASKYLAEVFDPLLHEEILSYRPLRRYHNSEEAVITNRDNAIENLQHYRQRHRRAYVAECDIQKYFDTINHDVIRECISKFVQRIQAVEPDFDYSSVGRIVDAYLCSYSFYDNVLVENERLMRENPPKRFEAPKTELFLARGCYDEQGFSASHDKIGIPQGGALSGLISNIVLNTVDHECGLDGNDPHKFFCRYSDDILLMHTSKEECQRLISLYCETLTKYKLLYHEFISVSDAEFRRKDNSVRSLLWDQKSRSPFLWGRSKDDAESVDWIGFLGYEIRYTGEVRLRRSSLNDKFKSVKSKYYNCVQSKLANGELSYKTTEALTKRVEKRINRFAGKGFSEAKSLNSNKYLTTQALKLNRYTSRHLYRMLYKIAIRNNAIADLPSWWQYAKARGCMNYLRTINRCK